MNTYLPFPTLRTRYRKVALLGIFALMGGSLQSYAQTTPLFQTFGDDATADNNFPYSTSNATNIGTGVTKGTYTVQRQDLTSTTAYGVRIDNNGNGNSGSTQVDLARKIFDSGSGAGTPNNVSFEVGSYDAGGTSGFDATSTIDVFASVNNASFTRIVRVIGSATSRPYNVGSTQTGAVQPVFTDYTDTNNNIATVTALNPVTKVTVNLPSSNTAGTSVIIRIVISVATQGQILIDNVTLTSGDPSKPLPVELTRFDATAKAQGVSLNWATATEKNSDRFEIQRSATGEAFETVGIVKGQGSTTLAHNYSFLDSHTLAGTSYYRLRQVDTDGTVSLSPVVAVQAEASTKVAFYPNPSANQLILPAGVGAVQYRIFNALGQTLLSGKATDNDRLDITSLPKGPFFLELSGAAGNHTQRLMRE